MVKCLSSCLEQPKYHYREMAWLPFQKQVLTLALTEANSQVLPLDYEHLSFDGTSFDPNIFCQYVYEIREGI